MKLKCLCGYVMGNMTGVEPHINFLIKAIDLTELYDAADEGNLIHGDNVQDFLENKKIAIWRCPKCQRIMDLTTEPVKFYKPEYAIPERGNNSDISS
jgi:hypothetical protein